MAQTHTLFVLVQLEHLVDEDLISLFALKLVSVHALRGVLSQLAACFGHFLNVLLRIVNLLLNQLGLASTDFRVKQFIVVLDFLHH